MAPKRSYKSVRAAWMQKYAKKASFKKSRRVARVKGGIPVVQELKFVDSGVFSLTHFTGATQLVLLNGISQGSDYTNREGRQATMHSVHIRGYVTPQNTTTTTQGIRLVLVWDNAANGAIAAVTDVMSADDDRAFANLSNQNRFTILRDWHQVAGQLSTIATQTYALLPIVHDVDIYVKLKSVTQYMGTGNSISAVQGGALLLIALGAAASGSGSVSNLAARVRFSDD